MASLSSLFGQDSAARALRRALESDCLAGAYLFVGAVGVGKGAVARAFAQAAACLEPRCEPFDACGVCDSCRRVEAGTQPEVVTLLPAGEQMQIWQFWDRDNRPTPGVLSHTLAFAPNIGRRRVYILERADTLTESAANSLLKVLEEPPPYALFVLLAPHPARVLPTIVSRCQMVRLNAVPVETLAAYLRDTVGVEAGRAAMLAAYAEGRIGQAMQLAQNPTVGEEIARVLDFAETLPDAPRVRALRSAEQMRKLAGQIKALVGEEPSVAPEAATEEGDAAGPKERAGRRQLAAVFDLLTAFYRDLLALRIGGEGAQHIVNRERAAKLTRLAQTGGPERWVRCLDALLLARRRLDANANVALVTEVLAMTLIEK
jgi:DNA polymerase-3 subunit delta'